MSQDSKRKLPNKCFISPPTKEVCLGIKSVLTSIKITNVLYVLAFLCTLYLSDMSHLFDVDNTIYIYVKPFFDQSLGPFILFGKY